MVNRALQPPVELPKINVKKEVLSTTSAVPFYLLQFEEFDVVRVSFVFRAGVKYQNEPFLAGSVLSMLAEGTQNRSHREIADFIDFYGLFYDVSLDRDYTIVTVCALKRFFNEAMQIIEDILLHPVFPEKEFAVFRNKRKQWLSVEREKVDFMAREEFISAIYGKTHPYGSFFPAEEYDKLNSEKLKDFYQQRYTRENLFVVASGNLSAEESAEIERIASLFGQGEKEVYAFPAPTPTAKESYIEKEGALQSAIKIGRVLFDRNHPDFIPMQVVSTLLGGYFSSRLITNLREEKGYTYSVYATIVNMQQSGYFIVSTEVTAQHTDSAVEEIFKEMERLCTEPVPESELEMVKRVISGEVLRILDGPFGVTDVTIENRQNGKDNQYVSRMLQEIENMTADKVLDTARKYLNRESMTVVIAGKR